MAFAYSRAIGAMQVGMNDSGSATSSIDIDSAFIYETSGDAFLIFIPTPVAQVAGTLTVYLYCTAVTGTPDFQLEVYDGATAGDDDRPDAGGSDLTSARSTLGLAGADVDTWVSLTCTVSLTVKQGYWIVVKNTHGTPAANHAAFQTRGAFDGATLVAAGSVATSSYALFAGYTADGITSDPTMNAVGVGSVVVKFDSGELIGNPYVSSESHANNQNDRGTRVTFSEDLIVSHEYVTGSTASISGIEINAATGGANIAQVLRTHGLTYFVNAPTSGRFAPVTLTGATGYDLVLTLSGNNTVGTIYTMGEAEGALPADVLACRPFSCAYVDGATPGSYAVDTSKFIAWAMCIDENPAIAGGGGGAYIVGG